MEYLYVGKIVNTHGIKGELRIRSNFDKKDIVFKNGFTLYIGEGYVPEIINSYRYHKIFDMVTFERYNNINQVLNYVGMKVYVKRDDLHMNENDYVLEELIGLDIVESGEVLGKVDEIVYNNSNVLLSVSGLKHFYIPNNSNFIKNVNLVEGVIETENAKGLML